MVTQHTEETLNTLSNQMMSSMTSTELSIYLLDAMEYLKTEDLEGWKKRFRPAEEKEIPKPVVKRRRQTPVKADVKPEEKCRGCNSDKVIDDIQNGQLVCIACGLIQLLGVFTGDTAHCSYDQIQNMGRVHIHRYSRIVNFMTVIRFAEGDTKPEIDDETRSRLQAELVGRKINGYEVRKALCRLGLSRRYRRHSMTFVREWGGEMYPSIPGDVVLKCAKLFRRVEFFFDRHKHRIWPNRKTFFSYNFMLYQLLHEVGRPDLTGPHHLLKSEKLLAVQLDAYRKISMYTGLKTYD
jgi:hypothetical protein